MEARNRIEFIPGNLALICLTKGFRALVDVADLPLLVPYRWCVAVKRHGVYAVTNCRKGSSPSRLYMHHLIHPLEPGFFTDHRNRDGLDNRRGNLRSATKADNQRNQRRKSTNTSGFRGVSYDKRYGTWSARIRVNYAYRSLGTYRTAQEAARAYDRAAREYHGEFASLNFLAEGLHS